MSKNWPKVRLEEVLTKTNESIDLEADKTYREVTVRLWGKGVVLRKEVSGSEIASSRRMVVRHNQFLLSRIDARNGATGLVPKGLDGAVVTNDFPAFKLDLTRVEPSYLDWLSKTHDFVELCKAASEGTTNRVRLKEERFLALEILLPPLSEQKRIVARIEQLSAKIEEARGLRRRTVEESKSIVAGELHRRFVSDENTWPFATVGDAADIIDPNPSHRMPVYAESGIPFISTVDFVGAEGIRRNTVKHVQVATYKEQVERCAFSIGDILYSRIGTIGAARVLTDIWPFALSHVLVVVKPKATVLPRFILWYLRSDSIVSQASEATRSVGVPDLGIQRIRSFHMPLPCISEQRCIVAYLDDLQGKVDSLKRLQAETAAELDALLPSVLDKAFKGEL